MDIKIDSEVKMNTLLSTIRKRAKKDCCAICNKQVTSFCNSHSIPKMILKNIAQQGWIYHSGIISKLDDGIKETGLNKAGTFYNICKECDSRYFQSYENADNLTHSPSDKMMAEIALKNCLKQLYDTNCEIEACKILKNKDEEQQSFFQSRLKNVLSLDLKQFSDEVIFYKSIIENDVKDSFYILFYERLPYAVPIAVQSHIPLGVDMEGNTVNDNYDYTVDRTQFMHVCVFPMIGETYVLAFYHKRDKNYRQLKHQFSTRPVAECLRFLNYVIFEYTDNFYLAKTISKDITSNKVLQQLSREDNGLPDYGKMVRNWDDYYLMKELYQSPQMNEIPNLLSCDYAI